MRRCRRTIALLLIGGVLLMAIAPLSAGWQRRTRNTPGPLRGASQLLGVPLLPDELGAGARLLVEFAFGAVLTNPSSSWSWTDVTTDVQQANGQYINITPIGRPDEANQTPPASCSFQLDNRQNLYSKNNPLSPNWPNIKSNTPVRVRVTLDGGANWEVFFWGEATAFKPGWDTTGNYAIVNVSARGRMQRLDNHSNPLRSAMARAITTDAIQPLVYWPLEDGANSTQAASGLLGGSPMTFSVPPLPSFASSSGPNGSAPLPQFGPSGSTDTRSGDMMPVPASTVDTYWSVQIVAAFASDAVTSTVADATFAGWRDSGSWTNFYGYLNSADGSISIYGQSASTGVLSEITFDNSHNYRDSTFRLWRFEATQSGGNVVFKIYVNGVQTASTTVAGSITHIRQAGLSQLGLLTGNIWLGHLATYDTTPTDFTSAMNGYPGETPAARMTRLSSEEGVDFETVGFYDTNTTMGPQGINSYSNLMRECELTDAGFWYDGFTAGTQYQGISQRYDQAAALTLDASLGEIQPDFEPVDDDQRTINKMTVYQKDGSFATSEVESGPLGTGDEGIGVAESSLTINPVDSTRLYFRANWETHAGTVEGFRYPLIYLDIRANPTIATRWINRSDGFSGPVVPGCRVDVTNVSTYATQHPAGTVSLAIEGWSMRLSRYMWEIDLVCTPNRRYDVFKIGDSQLGRVQTDGSSMAADAPVGSTSLSVATQSGSVVWTTSAANPTDFPMYIEADGIKVTVTAVSGSTSPQAFTVDGSTVTKPLLTGKYVKVWHPGVIKY